MSLTTISFTDEKTNLILVEPRRSLIHIKEVNSSKLVEPPWMGDDWDTVYTPDIHLLLPDLAQTLGVYQVDSYLSFFFGSGTNGVITQRSIPVVRTHLEYALLEKLLSSYKVDTKENVINRQSFMEQIESFQQNIFEKITNTIPEIPDITKRRLSNIIAHRKTVFSDLFPLLLDDRVEEVFLDRPTTPVYFDHQNLGRCCTDIYFTESDVSRLATLLRSESNLHLDRRNPSLKTHLRINDSLLRFSLTLPPLSPDGLQMEIRRARSKPFTILELIENDTLPLDAAAVLLLAISSRLNITITGAPGSGKTTLMNALDAITPHSWRKLYIEDVLESRLLMNSHQVRFRVDPIDEVDMRFTKSSEIVKSLHRSPDYLILGEIQTQDHSEALFQALSAGIRTIQTCHSDSASGLVSRWIYNHDIDPSSVAHMDIIATMDRPVPGKSKRRLREIVEIRKKYEDGMVIFIGLNRIYNGLGSEQIANGWVCDGALNVRAQELGFDDYLSSLRSFIEHIKERIRQSGHSDEPLGVLLWTDGHPLGFGRNVH